MQAIKLILLFLPSAVFKDVNTKLPVEGAPPGEPDVVLLDAMGFGMGCCCLQLTFQACNITEARRLYDQLAPLCPIMLALTAASPVYRGYLTESDCRWNVISSSVDCRTDEERGLEPLKDNKFRIAKSRYDSIDSYLSPEGAKYNDVKLTYDDEVYQRLIDGGIDHQLAQHIAHLFIRDTVSLFSEKVHQNDKEDTDHFENIQSTNWQTMRFKPPPPNSSIGWRVEFRPCEAQISDFENAAIVCFVVLLTRVILSYQLNFLTPISKVDENMQTAQKRDACRKEKFWFRKSSKSTAAPQQNGGVAADAKINGSSTATTNGTANGKPATLLNGSSKLNGHGNGLNGNANGNGHAHNGINGDSDHTDTDDEENELFQLLSINEIFNGKVSKGVPAICDATVNVNRLLMCKQTAMRRNSAAAQCALLSSCSMHCAELLTAGIWQLCCALNAAKFKTFLTIHFPCSPMYSPVWCRSYEAICNRWRWTRTRTAPLSSICILSRSVRPVSL